MLREAAALGLAALVEVHDRPELERALAAGAGIVGINNRNLQTLKVDTETTYALRALVPAGTIVVSESGQRTRADLDRLAAAGVDAVLIGEAIMRAEDVEGKVRELLGHDGEPVSGSGDAEAAERRRHGAALDPPGEGAREGHECRQGQDLRPHQPCRCPCRGGRRRRLPGVRLRAQSAPRRSAWPPAASGRSCRAACRRSPSFATRRSRRSRGCSGSCGRTSCNSTAASARLSAASSRGR